MNLQVFNNFQFGRVTVFTIDNEPWFVAKEVTKILGYGKGNGASRSMINAISNHVHKDDQMIITKSMLNKLFKVHQNSDFENVYSDKTKENSQLQEFFKVHQNSDFKISNRGSKMINESGLYSLIMGSTLKEAKNFKRWVTHDILPAIRKTGEYRVAYGTSNGAYENEVNITIAKALLVSKELLDESRQAIHVLKVNNEIKEKEIEEAKPKLDYYNTILQSVNAIKTTQIAADYGLSARSLNQILHEERIQYKVNKQWILYAKHKNKGYTGSKSKIIHRSNGTDEAIITTYWTQKGRLFIHEILRHRGIVAVMDRDRENISTVC